MTALRILASSVIFGLAWAAGAVPLSGREMSELIAGVFAEHSDEHTLLIDYSKIPPEWDADVTNALIQGMRRRMSWTLMLIGRNQVLETEGLSETAREFLKLRDDAIHPGVHLLPAWPDNPADREPPRLENFDLSALRIESKRMESNFPTKIETQSLTRPQDFFNCQRYVEKALRARERQLRSNSRWSGQF
jgi:hypothetical protein